MVGDVSFSVFGALRFERASGEVHCPGPTERAVMASLLFTIGQPVTMEAAAALVWPINGAPKDPAHAIHTHVMRLRQHLGHDVIDTDHHTYRAAVERNAVDVYRFRGEVHRAEFALHNGDLDVAEAAYAQSLDACGNGEPWLDLHHNPVAAGECARLTELRLVAEERRAALALVLDRLPVGELERLVTEQPLRENRWELLMHLQAIQGRQADALRSFTTARLALQELGINPGAGLRAMEHRVLVQDPSLLDPESARVHLVDHYA